MLPCRGQRSPTCSASGSTDPTSPVRVSHSPDRQRDMTPQKHTITEVTASTHTTATLWDELTQQLETLFELSTSNPVRTPRALTEQISKVDAASASLRAVFNGLNRRDHVAASLYDQVDALLTSSLRMAAQPHATPDISASIRDLAARVSYATRYPAMVQHAMLCDSIDDQNWPHHDGVRTDPAVIAAHLSLAAAVAQHCGEDAQIWAGYTLTEQHRASVRAVAETFPVLEQIPEWFGRDLPSRRWTLTATGALDDLDDDTAEIALGLLNGWNSSVRELLEAAQHLAR